MSAETLMPWFHSDDVLWGCVTTREGGDGLIVATVAARGDPDDIKATARLMAAAPDLLAALKAMVGAEAESGADDEYLRGARAAIAKARGGK